MTLRTTSLCAALLVVAACSGDSTATSATDGSTESTTEGTTTAAETSTSTTTAATAGTTAASGSSSAGTATDSTTGTTTSSTDATTSTSATTDATTGVDPTDGYDGFHVGVDVVDVSPTPAEIAGNNIYMGAYGAPYTRGPAKGVHDAIFVRSFALSVQGEGVITAILDLPGMGNQNIRAIRKEVAAATGLDELHVMVGTTHSHSTPDFQGLWGGIPKSYRESVNARVAASMIAAWEARVPATLSVATGKAPNNNRRDWGFTDDDMTVLDASDLEGARIGTLVDFAAHPVILGEGNKEVSCDYTGPLVLALEAELGAPVAFFNGTLGDASPAVPQGDYIDDFERASAYGELLASIAADLVASAEGVDDGLAVDSRAWDQTVDNALFNLAATLGLLQYDFESNGLGKSVHTQSTYFRLGTQVQVVAFPGESLTRNGLSIKEAMAAPHKIILGNTGDALGYFIPSDEWQTGKNDNYEESVSLGKNAGDNARDQIVGMLAADPF